MQYLDQDRRQLYIDSNRVMLILFLIIICKGNVQAANVQYSGYCGYASAFKSVRWNYADGVLTISGEGDMAD